MSSASRWLASLLHNHDSAQAISFPEISEDGFAAVIAYVYGEEMKLNPKNAYNILPVLRLLEMPQLEERCWDEFMTMTTPVSSVFMFVGQIFCAIC